LGLGHADTGQFEPPSMALYQSGDIVGEQFIAFGALGTVEEYRFH
jgi:hypothetical protein